MKWRSWHTSWTVGSPWIIWNVDIPVSIGWKFSNRNTFQKCNTVSVQQCPWQCMTAATFPKKKDKQANEKSQHNNNCMSEHTQYHIRRHPWKAINQRTQTCAHLWFLRFGYAGLRLGIYDDVYSVWVSSMLHGISSIWIEQSSPSIFSNLHAELLTAWQPGTIRKSNYPSAASIWRYKFVYS